MNIIRHFVSGFTASICAAAASGAQAQLTPDPTGYWFDPAQPGWGAYVAQQDGSTSSVTLFIYDEAGRPTFVTSTRMSAADIDPLPPDPINGTGGGLLRTTGPWFGGSFQPPVAFSDAGFVDVWYPTGTQGEVLMIDYILDGHHVQKSLKPMTIAVSRASLADRYIGGVVLAGAKPAGCTLPAAPPGATEIAIDETSVRWSTTTETACVLTGAYSQRGQLGIFSGDLACGAFLGGPPSHATMTITGLSAGRGGFMGKVTVQDGNCTYTGRIGGVRQ